MQTVVQQVGPMLTVKNEAGCTRNDNGMPEMWLRKQVNYACLAIIDIRVSFSLAQSVWPMSRFDGFIQSSRPGFPGNVP